MIIIYNFKNSCMHALIQPSNHTFKFCQLKLLTSNKELIGYNSLPQLNSYKQNKTKQKSIQHEK